MKTMAGVCIVVCCAICGCHQWGAQKMSNEAWNQQYAAEINSNVTGAAFALAVWEITFEDLYANPPGWTVSSGKFKARDDGGNTSLAITQANNWLSQIDGTGKKVPLRGLTNGSNQDFLVPVPEPATLSLVAIGGLAMLLRKRK